jgi:hypothetical protein
MVKTKGLKIASTIVFWVTLLSLSSCGKSTTLSLKPEDIKSIRFGEMSEQLIANFDC